MDKWPPRIIGLGTVGLAWWAGAPLIPFGFLVLAALVAVAADDSRTWLVLLLAGMATVLR